MRFTIPTVAAALLAAFPLTAHAEGGNAPPPVGPQVVPSSDSDWTGPYLGLSFGRLDTEDGVDSDDTNYIALSGGYLWDFGDIVLGADLGYYEHEEFDGAFAGYDDREIRLRARLGYDLGRVLPYVSLGVSHWTLDFGPDSGSDTTFGYGIGAEFMVTESLMLGVDYYYSSNDSFDVGFIAPYEKTARTFGLGLSFRF